MFSKIFVLLASFINAVTPPVHQDRVISVNVPEDEFMIENIRPKMASMYY